MRPQLPVPPPRPWSRSAPAPRGSRRRLWTAQRRRKLGMSSLPPCATGTMWSICSRVGRATGHAGERVLVAAGSTVLPPHCAPHRSRDVPPRAARPCRFGCCWRCCRAFLGQPRSHCPVRLRFGPSTNDSCPRRRLVRRRTGGAAPILLAARGRYRLRSPVLRRTASQCDAGAGGGRSGGGKVGIGRPGGVVRSPIATSARYQRRPLVLRGTGGVAPLLLAARHRYPLRSPVLRRTVGECAAGAGGGRSGTGKPASAEPAAWYGVRSPLRPGTSDARWFCAEPVESRRCCSLLGADTRCVPRFCAEPSASAPLGPAAGGAAPGKPASADPAAAGPGAGATATVHAATEPRAAPVVGTPSPAPGAPVAQVDEPALDPTAPGALPVAGRWLVTPSCCSHVSACRAGVAVPRFLRPRSRIGSCFRSACCSQVGEQLPGGEARVHV